MSPTRALTRRPARISTFFNPPIRQISQTTTSLSSASNPHTSPPPSLQKIFATPTWSARALLPNPSPSSPPDTAITPTTLHHLLRLSSLPLPTTPAEESALLHTLHTQLHFVRAIQAVDTTGVAPLTSIRDEKKSTIAATAVTLDTLKEALADETSMGFRGRPRRGRESGRRERSAEEALVEERTRGRRARGYYVVESGKAKGGE